MSQHQKLQEGKEHDSVSLLWLWGYHTHWPHVRVLQSTRTFLRSSSYVGDSPVVWAITTPWDCICSSLSSMALCCFSSLTPYSKLLYILLPFTDERLTEVLSLSWWNRHSSSFKDCITESHTLWLLEILLTSSWMQAKEFSSWRTVFWRQLQPKACCHWF